jgi:NADH-quinone oxidoreductase subunit M
MWPVHTWLPDVHVEAPTGGSAVLAAIMLKLGAYGFLRFSMPIAPDASHEWAWLMIALSLIAVIYVGLVAMVQQDMKKLVAYSSVAHMGFVTLGFFIFNDLGVAGGIVQMIAHGFVSAAMFLCIGVLYDRVHSREIASYGGVVNTMPNFTAFALLFAMANCGLPATAGFVGEWMVILGAVKANFWLGLRRRDGAGSSARPTRCGCTSASTSARSSTTTCVNSRTSTPRVPDAGPSGDRRALDGHVIPSPSPTS